MTQGSNTRSQKLALVTGAAHRLGKAIALELARNGYAIGLHYFHSSQAAETTAAEIRDLGVPAHLYSADLTVPDEVDRLFNEVAGLDYPLEVLVNSAAVMPRASLVDISADTWDKTLALNLRSPMLCAQAAARLMGELGGLIVNLTDAGDQKAWTAFPAYTISKAGLESLTRLLARALAPRIRVNAVAPGLILPPGDMDTADWQRLVARLPLKRAGTPEEVARAVVFLAQNPYITGQTLVIDGGYQII